MKRENNSINKREPIKNLENSSLEEYKKLIQSEIEKNFLPWPQFSSIENVHDLQQEIMVVFLNKFSEINYHKAWIRRVARNQVLSFVNKDRRRLLDGFKTDAIATQLNKEKNTVDVAKGRIILLIKKYLANQYQPSFEKDSSA